MENKPDKLVREDYVHSANSLFHFMKSPQYLIDALKRKALCPRYCKEDVAYLSIRNGKYVFGEIAVLQKCFCDIPLHNVTKRFPIKLTDNNNLTAVQVQEIPEEWSHPELYGAYALAFTKEWGEKSKLQPIHYLTKEGSSTTNFSLMFNRILSQTDASEEITNALLNWLCYTKPLRGTMKRSHKTKEEDRFDFEIFKNFHDEHEWRYVPFNLEIEGKEIDSIVANEKVLMDTQMLQFISDKLEKYQEAWLNFDYDDIRYIIVPDKNGRIVAIKAINDLDNSVFNNNSNIDLQRSLLISKILVLNEIKKDF